MNRILAALLLILCCATLVEAEIYTWTDEQGTVTYTDNPALVPARYGRTTKAGENTVIRSPPVRKEIRKHGKQWSQAVIPGNRAKSVAAAKAQFDADTLEIQAERKGHLGGDQTDPAPPGMKQPKAASTGDQPKPAAAGMKQPKAAATDEQPQETPAGMKQPEAEPTGDQPKPAPLGMEQPVPKL